MPLLDRAKQLAGQVAEGAKEAGQAGQAKLDEMNQRRQIDATLRKLGALVYLDHAGRGGADAESEVQRLVGEIETYEHDHEPITAD